MRLSQFLLDAGERPFRELVRRHLERQSATQIRQAVLLEKDRTGDTVDRYGRLLRYVYLDGDNFNARLIREGYAHAYRRFPFSKRQEFIQLEDQAKRREIGLWNDNGNDGSHD